MPTVTKQAILAFIKGGDRPFTFENTILSYGLGAIAWTCTNNLRVVLGTCAQCCSCEASEQKVGQNPKAKQNEIELSCLHYLISLGKLFILVMSNVKIG